MKHQKKPFAPTVVLNISKCRSNVSYVAVNWFDSSMMLIGLLGGMILELTELKQIRQGDIDRATVDEKRLNTALEMRANI